MNRRRDLLILTANLSVIAVLTTGGCYRHVVRDDGLSGDQKVYEPNLKNERSKFVTETENLIFGEQKPLKQPPR